jgi:hypothetical protein
MTGDYSAAQPRFRIVHIRLILVGEGSLRRAIPEFAEHHHHERNHQGMRNLLIVPPSTIARGDRSIVCRRRRVGC